MITVGTDCSGIEAPIEALKQLNVDFEHKWACEIDKFARQSILANYKPGILYEDITNRNHSLLPDIDIYICGFPCQSFSLMGKKQGTKDPRSNIMLQCINVIQTKKPSIFILENVKNFKFIEKGKPFNYLLNKLYEIEEDEDSKYNIYYDIYDTQDYGIPQHRERIYIIGISKNIQIDNFNKPVPIEMKNLDDFVLDKNICTSNIGSKIIIDKLSKNKIENSVITPFLFCSPPKNVCPTLTTSCHRFFLTKYKRTLLTKECLLLQGFNKDFNQVVSKTQLCKQIGNSMSVNVLKFIFSEIFRCTLLPI
jgi:DNA (cytosine-5)-methyltransferase 1